MSISFRFKSIIKTECLLSSILRKWFILENSIYNFNVDRYTISFALLRMTDLALDDRNDLDRYVMKEVEILDKNDLFWGYHLQEGYEKRVELCRYAPKESSPKRKAQNEVWKDLIEQVVRDVVG